MVGLSLWSMNKCLHTLNSFESICIAIEDIWPRFRPDLVFPI